MAERTQMVVKHARFAEADLPAIVLSDPTLIQMDVPSSTIRLVADVNGHYPVNNLTTAVTSRILNVGVFRSFSGFTAMIKHERVEGAIVTLARFRLTDGTTLFWWNGSTWAIPTLNTQWNTEEEIATNIGMWQTPLTTGGRFGAVVNLQTSDRTVTPQLYEVRFGVNLRIHSWMEDMLYRSLAQDLKAKLRPVTDLIYTMTATVNTIDIGALITSIGIPFSPIDVDAAYNRTDAPEVDMRSGYNPSTKILTLNAPVASGKQMLIALIYQPEVVVNLTHQDFSEVEKVPAIIINSIELQDASPLQQGDYVINKSNSVALYVPPPYQGDIAFKMDILTPGGVDLARLFDAVLEYAENNRVLQSKALGEGFRFWLKEEFTNNSRPSGNDIHTAQCSGEICDVVFYKRAAQTTTRVDSVKLRGDFDQDIDTSGP